MIFVFIFFPTFQTKYFIIDVMHTIDGGVLKLCIMIMFTIGFEPGKAKLICGKYTAAVMEMFEKCMKAWRPNISSDFARQPRSLKEINFWKMRETNIAGIFMIPALIWVDGVKDELQMPFFSNFMNLITGMRLVYNFSHKALPKVITRLDVR